MLGTIILKVLETRRLCVKIIPRLADAYYTGIRKRLKAAVEAGYGFVCAGIVNARSGACPNAAKRHSVEIHFQN